ncbi:Inner membrane transport protein RhmT [Serratia fonticola]|uniref:Inner membrane transport protein RhmT n=1 Tax=Serratia fonticola TaxID=47917 RepID=A0A4U9W5Y3_SERFO|nr:Inner membrane transport protein RhmT [Serratia fonticola]
MFEIPSNAGTIKFGPRIWFARILITWGIFAVLMGFVRTPMELYICRFMLGVCEAGFFPSVVYYFTVFFPEKYRTKNPRHVYHRTAVVERYRFTDFWADP